MSTPKVPTPPSYQEWVDAHPAGEVDTHNGRGSHGCGRDHGETCECGKNGTPEAHGYNITVKGFYGLDGRDGDVTRLSCADVNAIRERVAVDLTRENMSRWERLTTLVQGRAGEYTSDAYEQAWAQPRDAHVDGAAR